MNKQFFLALTLVVLLCGCATRYEITTTGSARYTSVGRPRREDGWYVFKDVMGREIRLSAMRVTSIGPAPRWGKSKDPFGAPSK